MLTKKYYLRNSQGIAHEELQFNDLKLAYKVGRGIARDAGLGRYRIVHIVQTSDHRAVWTFEETAAIFHQPGTGPIWPGDAAKLGAVGALSRDAGE